MFAALLFVSVASGQFLTSARYSAAPATLAYQTAVPVAQPWVTNIPTSRFTRTEWAQPTVQQIPAVARYAVQTPGYTTLHQTAPIIASPWTASYAAAISSSFAEKLIPLVVTTWKFPEASDVAYKTVIQEGKNSLDAIEDGISWCEERNGSVGWGGKPDESGQFCNKIVPIFSTISDG